MNLVNSSPHQLPPCPCVVHAIVGLTHGGFSLVGGNLKLNVPDVDTWCDLGACLSRRFIHQEKCHVAHSDWFMSFQYLGLSPINSGIPLLPSQISHIFSFDLCRPAPCLGVFFRP